MSDDEGIDLTGESGEEGTKRGRGRPSNAVKAGELERDIAGDLSELAEWIGKRDPELARVLGDDAKKIARYLAKQAEKRVRVAGACRKLFGPDGWLAALRAFGPTVRALLEKLGRRRREQDENEEREGQVVEGVFERVDTQA